MITIIGENTGLDLMTRVENGMKEEELVRSEGNVGVKALRSFKVLHRG